METQGFFAGIVVVIITGLTLIYAGIQSDGFISSILIIIGILVLIGEIIVIFKRCHDYFLSQYRLLYFVENEPKHA